MNTAALIKHFQNRSLLICILEARNIIEELTFQLEKQKDCETYTQEENEEKHLEKQLVEHEIYYYETCIYHTQQNYKDDPQSSTGYSLKIPYTEDQLTKMDHLEMKVNGIEVVVCQLVGGLFNREKQSNIMHDCLSYLSGKEPLFNDVNESSDPTTRQGDANEEEIRLLKQQVFKLEGTVKALIQLISDKCLL